MNKRQNSMKKAIMNSKLNITKNFLYFMIVPLIVLVVGIVLACTVGFNLGTDFAGGTTFKVYANYENIIESENVKSYDLNDSSDYDVVYDKIINILEDNDLKVVSYRTTTMNISDYNIVGGQAVEIIYQNEAKSTDGVRDQIIAEFGYQDFDQAVSSFDTIQSSYSFDYVIGIVSALVFALVAVIIYLSARYNVSAMFVTLLQVAIDVFLSLSLILITRIPVNMTLGIVLFTTFLFTVFNVMYYYMKMKDGVKQGKFDKMRNSEMANTLTKEITCKKIFVYIALFVIALLFTIFAVQGVREVALGIIISLVVTFYTSQFILPTLWATMYSKKKKNKNYNNQQKDIS